MIKFYKYFKNIKKIFKINNNHFKIIKKII